MCSNMVMSEINLSNEVVLYICLFKNKIRKIFCYHCRDPSLLKAYINMTIGIFIDYFAEITSRL